MIAINHALKNGGSSQIVIASEILRHTWDIEKRIQVHLERISLVILLLEGRLLWWWLVGSRFLGSRRWRGNNRGNIEGFRGGLLDNLIFRRLENLDGIGQWLVGSEFTSRIPAFHAEK